MFGHSFMFFFILQLYVYKYTYVPVHFVWVFSCSFLLHLFSLLGLPPSPPFNTAFRDSFEKNEVRFEDHSHDRRTSLGWWNRVCLGGWDRSTLFLLNGAVIWSCKTYVSFHLAFVKVGKKLFNIFMSFFTCNSSAKRYKCVFVEIWYETWPLAAQAHVKNIVCRIWLPGNLHLLGSSSCETQSGFTWLQRSFRRGGPSIEGTLGIQRSSFQNCWIKKPFPLEHRVF